MLGGRTSFGPGGWAQTELADILPVEIHPGDGQIEPEGGIKFVPSTTGLDELHPPGRRQPRRDGRSSGTRCRRSWAPTASASPSRAPRSWPRRPGPIPSP